MDHLIPLELGGSNRLTNLWPEPYDFSDGSTVQIKLADPASSVIVREEVEHAD